MQEIKPNRWLLLWAGIVFFTTLLLFLKMRFL